MPVHGPGRAPFLNTAPDSAKKGKTGRPQSPSKRGSAAARLQLVIAKYPEKASSHAMVSSDFHPPMNRHLATRPLAPPLNMARMWDYALRQETNPTMNDRFHPLSTFPRPEKVTPLHPRVFMLLVLERSFPEKSPVRRIPSSQHEMLTVRGPVENSTLTLSPMGGRFLNRYFKVL